MGEKCAPVQNQPRRSWLMANARKPSVHRPCTHNSFGQLDLGHPQHAAMDDRAGADAGEGTNRKTPNRVTARRFADLTNSLGEDHAAHADDRGYRPLREQVSRDLQLGCGSGP